MQPEVIWDHQVTGGGGGTTFTSMRLKSRIAFVSTGLAGERQEDRKLRVTYRFLDFFFLVPSGPTSQLHSAPALSCGESKRTTVGIIRPGCHRACGNQTVLNPQKKESWRMWNGPCTGLSVCVCVGPANLILQHSPKVCFLCKKKRNLCK